LFISSCKTDNAIKNTKEVLPVKAIEAETEIITQDSIQKLKTFLNAKDKAKKFHKYFNHLHRAGIFNGNVLIAQRGIPIYEESFGYSDLRKKNPLTKNPKFQIASVSKQFTAVAIMQLYEQGLLDYNDSLQKYFPDFPYKGITIHMLLTHTSGLPNYTYLCDRKFPYKDSAVYNNEVLNCLTQYHPAKYYKPGKRFDYSNTGYVILASIVEKISGVSFPEYLNKNIFKPLGMNNTFVYVKGKTHFPQNTTKGYKSWRRKAEDIFLNGVYGDKGIYTTTGDLLKWDQGLYTGKIISYETLQRAFKPWAHKRWTNKYYGYGWRIYNSQIAGKVIYHSGWWYGYQSLLVRLEKDKSTIIVLKNKKTMGLINQTKLFEILYSDEIEGQSNI
jgi:CubicO group peptidase (beta-lactamase class C family)